MYRIILLLLPGVLSKMTVNVFGGPDARVEVSGSQVDVISDTERSVFHINDTELKEATNKLHGKTPSDVFVRGPTPWDDLYKRYNWTEVSRNLTLKNANIVSYRKEETVIASKNFHNDGLEPVTYMVNITQVVENTIRHSWINIGYLTVSDKIDYNVSTGAKDVGNFSSQNSFLADGANMIPATIGSKSSINITLKANESAVAVLKAIKEEIDVEVEFEASLSGEAAANYALTHKGHHFWNFNINELLDAAGLPKIKSWKENVTVSFFTDEQLSAFDLNGTLIQ